MINVLKMLVGALVLSAGLIGASAETNYVLTFTGTVDTSSNAYANSGDAFSGTFTLNAPVPVSGAPGNYFEETVSSPTDDSYMDSTTTGLHATTAGESGTAPDNDATVAIFSNYSGYGHPPTPIYGYQFNSSDLPAGTYQGYEFWQLTINLESSNSFVAPTGTLADLGNFPVSDFNVKSFGLTLEQASYTNMVFTGYVPVAYENGTVNSYAIQKSVAASPEPATWMLLLAGVALAGGALRGRRLVR